MRFELQPSAGQLAHLLVHQFGTSSADLDQQPQNRVAVHVQHALSAADAVPFDQGGDDLDAAG